MSTSVEVKAKKDLTWLHFGVMVVLMFGVGFIPPIGDITVVGMKMLGTFLGLLYGWSTCGMFWPSLLGWIAIGFSGIAPMKQIMTQGFGNEIIVFVVFILVLVQMLSDSGAIDNVANYIITRKVLQGRPWLFSTVFLCASGLLATLGQAYAALFLCWGLLTTIFEKVGYKPYEKYPTMMFIGVVISFSPFGLMIPFKAMPLVIISSFTAITGVEINYLLYMCVMVPVGIVLIAGYILACRFILRPDVSKLQNFDVTSLQKENGEITKHQKAVLIGFGIALLLLLIPGSLPSSWALTQYISGMGNASLMIICTVCLSIIKVEGKPLLDFGHSARSGVNWPILFMLVVIMLLSSLLMSDATGLKPWLVTVLSPILTGFSGIAFLVVMFVIALILTNFMNNIIVGIMFLPVLGTFYASVGANPAVGVLLILLAINIAFLTPAASPTAAMCYAKSDWMHKQDVLKVMCLTIVVYSLIGLPLTLLIGHVIF